MKYVAKFYVNRNISQYASAGLTGYWGPRALAREFSPAEKSGLQRKGLYGKLGRQIEWVPVGASISGWMYTDATNLAVCPRCGCLEGEVCRTPKGRKCNKPHDERVSALMQGGYKPRAVKLESFHEVLTRATYGNRPKEAEHGKVDRVDRSTSRGDFRVLLGNGN